MVDDALEHRDAASPAHDLFHTGQNRAAHRAQGAAGQLVPREFGELLDRGNEDGEVLVFAHKARLHCLTGTLERLVDPLGSDKEGNGRHGGVKRAVDDLERLGDADALLGLQAAAQLRLRQASVGVEPLVFECLNLNNANSHGASFPRQKEGRAA